jgi:hypothetical protein
MADEANPQATDVASAENTAAASATETPTSDSNQTSTEQQVENQGEADKAEPAASDKKQSENQDSKTDSKPLSRRSATFRIQQLTRENKELREQVKPKDQQDDDGVGEHRAGEQSNISELVQQEVQKALNPVITESSKAADDAEVNELFADKTPEIRAKYEPKIRSMWNLPQYKDVSAADLFKILDHDSIAGSIEKVKVEAVEEHKKAEKEAKESSAGGTNNSNRTGKTGKSVADMTPQELEEHNQRVIAGRV